jgi:hypothetical protein
MKNSYTKAFIEVLFIGFMFGMVAWAVGVALAGV